MAMIDILFVIWRGRVVARGKKRVKCLHYLCEMTRRTREIFKLTDLSNRLRRILTTHCVELCTVLNSGRESGASEESDYDVGAHFDFSSSEGVGEVA